MEYFYWLMIFFLLTYEPIYGYYDYQRFKTNLQTSQIARMKYYKKIMAGLWIPTLVILGLVIFGPITASDIGLTSIHISTDPLGKWLTYGVISIGLAYFILLLYYWAAAKLSEAARSKIEAAKKNELEKSSFIHIMPVTKEEKKTWTLVSWTAGITEELLYRGFLIFALNQMFPGLNLWAILIVSSILFGLAHTYQGLANVIRTSVIGFVFALLYTSLGSLIPLFILHFLADYIGKAEDVEAADRPA